MRTTLTFRLALLVFVALAFFWTPAEAGGERALTPCTTGLCPPPTDCTTCPAAEMCVTTTIAPRDLGPRFNQIALEKFPTCLGELKKVGVRIKIQPGFSRYRVENTGTTTCNIQPTDSTYLVTGYIDVRDPTLPPGSFLCTTRDKVDGVPGSNGSLNWDVQGDLLATGPSQLPPFDGCYDYNDPAQTPVFNVCNCTGPHGGPCVGQPSDGPASGTRTKCGASVGAGVQTCGGVTPVPPPSGFTDGKVFGVADEFTCNLCITEPGRISYFLDTSPGATAVLPLETLGITSFPSWFCSGIDQEEDIQIGITVTLSYYYCPRPPDAFPDTGDVCRTVGAQRLINVLQNDFANENHACTQTTLNCAALTGSAGISGVESFATAVWVTDPSCTNALCNQKCIRYTLTALPPAGVTTDTFTYTIQNSNGCTDTATVTVTIASPVANNDPNTQLCRAVGANAAINVLANDTSTRPLDCAFLTGSAGISGVESFATATWVTDGSCTNGLCNQRCIRYTLTSLPPPGLTVDTFTYTIRDNLGCTAQGTVTVTIASPVCATDCLDLCATAGATGLINVLANDSSPRPLDCAFLSGTAGITGVDAFASATWVTDPSCTNSLCDLKCIRYTVNSTPPAGVTSDTFSYTLRDTNGCTTTCTVTVNLCVLNAVTDLATVCQGKSQAICVLGNDTSSCGPLGCANLSLEGQPANGQAVISTSCVASDGCDTMPAGCTCCIVYTPNPGFIGEDVFQYRLSATSAGCGTGGLACTTLGTVRVTVKPAPVAQNDFYEIPLGGVLPPFDVRLNDSPGTGCEIAGCGGPCTFTGCPEITSGLTPAFGTLTLDPVTCLFTYTLPATGEFPGTVSFCYRIRNNCGCCAEACVTISDCPTPNRRNPGSLLLWPEYDNRAPMRTMLTVTNTDCSPGAQPIRVEFIYINKENCLESNVTAMLTPCDTFTAYTSAHVPSTFRGYVYAFVKDHQNKPISYNHLIGIAWVLDPVTTDAYGFNALPLRSPLAQGLRTDLDLDNIRDLDGNEYEVLPDQLLIPRFLGQDLPSPGSVFHSDLVLLGLSGGRAFTTTVYFLIYNDSEDVFSREASFYCWEKRPLLQWSAAFENSFLMAAGDDPEEIYGAVDRVGGWLRLDGRVAMSTMEQIEDPAIYALLIEKATNFNVADLPWEICGQNNGDLLPTGIFGDGPAYVAGDNQ